MRQVKLFAPTNDFERFISMIFSSSATALAGRTRQQQQCWWKTMYRSRRQEQLVFEEFLSNEEVSLCHVVGHVGSGKSTFVLEKLQREEGKRICNGFRLNISAVASSLDQLYLRELGKHSPSGDYANLTPTATSLIEEVVFNKLCALVAQEVQARFAQHFTLLLLKRPRSNQWENLRKDVYHRLGISWKQVSDVELQSKEYDALVFSAAVMVLNRSGDKYIKLREKIFRSRSKKIADDDVKSRLEEVCRYLRDLKNCLALAPKSPTTWTQWLWPRNG